MTIVHHEHDVSVISYKLWLHIQHKYNTLCDKDLQEYDEYVENQRWGNVL